MNRRTPFCELPAPTLADRRIITQGDDGLSLLAAGGVRKGSTNPCDRAASVARSVSFASADVLLGGKQAFQVFGVAVADADLACGVLLGEVRVKQLVAIASE